MAKVRARAVTAFHFGAGLNLAAGQVITCDASDLKRFGPTRLVLAGPADPTEGGASRAKNPAEGGDEKEPPKGEGEKAPDESPADKQETGGENK